MTPAEPRVLVLVINYETPDDVLKLVASTESLSLLPDITLLDNSASVSQALASVEYGAEYRYRHSGRNLGYFGAASSYLREVGWATYDWVFVSNADIHFGQECAFGQLTPDGVVGVQRAVGVYGPSIISTARECDQNPHRRVRPRRRDVLKHIVLTSWSGFGQLYRRRERRLVRSLERGSEPEVVFAVQGSFLGFHRSFLDAAVLPAGTFLFWEEELVGLEAQRAGLSAVYDPRVAIFHDEHHSIGDPYSPTRMRQRNAAARAMYRKLIEADHAR